MKRSSIFFVILAVFFTAFISFEAYAKRGSRGYKSSKSSYSSRSAGAVKVKGYYRKNGTYVAPHYRSKPNSTKADNYSTKGNTNPFTGMPGTVDP